MKGQGEELCRRFSIVDVYFLGLLVKKPGTVTISQYRSKQSNTHMCHPSPFGRSKDVKQLLQQKQLVIKVEHAFLAFSCSLQFHARALCAQ